jgi:hypothetical protein
MKTLTMANAKAIDITSLRSKIFNATSFEDALVQATPYESTGKLFISKHPFISDPTLCFSYSSQNITPNGENAVAIEPEELTGKKFKLKPLSETAYPFADKIGFTPDSEWLEKRNTRLKIKWHDGFGDYVAPATAVKELILSYALSSSGFCLIKKRLDEDERCRVQFVYSIDLVFLGENWEKGWQERYLVLETDLKKLVERRKAQNKTKK